MRGCKQVSPYKPPNFDPDFDRQVDTTIIKVNLAVDVARNLVQDALHAALVNAAGVHWKLEGPDCGQRFVIQFAGCGGLAAQRASKLPALYAHGGRDVRSLLGRHRRVGPERRLSLIPH